MPRIIITNDNSPHDDPVVVLDERVQVAQLSEDQGALRFIERLGWAISDAEDSTTSGVVSSHPSSLASLTGRRRAGQPQGVSTRRRARSAVASLLPRATS